MTLLITDGPKLIINGQPVQENSGLSPPQDPTAQISAELSSQRSDASDVHVQTNITYGAPLGISNIQQAVNTTAEAVSAVQNLRSQQESLTTEASGLSFGKQTTDIAAATAKIQTEIQSIATSATSVDGNPVLTKPAVYQYTADSYRSDGTKFSQTAVIAIGTSPSLTQSPGDAAFFGTAGPGFSQAGNLYASPQEAATAKTELDQNLSALGSVGADVESAQKQAKLLTDLPDKNPTAPILPQAPPLTDFNEAKDLSQQIANQLGAPYVKDFQTKQLLDTISSQLDPDRISKLLGEA